jgi:hypothetical protein
MTWRAFEHLQTLLKLDASAMAAFLGVHVSTIYRWRNTGRIVADPLQTLILEKVSDYVDSAVAADILGTAIRAGLVKGGTLHALRDALVLVLETPKSPRT